MSDIIVRLRVQRQLPNAEYRKKFADALKRLLSSSRESNQQSGEQSGPEEIAVTKLKDLLAEAVEKHHQTGNSSYNRMCAMSLYSLEAVFFKEIAEYCNTKESIAVYEKMWNVLYGEDTAFAKKMAAFELDIQQNHLKKDAIYITAQTDSFAGNLEFARAMKDVLGAMKTDGDGKVIMVSKYDASAFAVFLAHIDPNIIGTMVAHDVVDKLRLQKINIGIKEKSLSIAAECVAACSTLLCVAVDIGKVTLPAASVAAISICAGAAAPMTLGMTVGIFVMTLYNVKHSEFHDMLRNNSMIDEGAISRQVNSSASSVFPGDNNPMQYFNAFEICKAVLGYMMFSYNENSRNIRTKFGLVEQVPDEVETLNEILEWEYKSFTGSKYKNDDKGLILRGMQELGLQVIGLQL